MSVGSGAFTSRVLRSLDAINATHNYGFIVPTRTTTCPGSSPRTYRGLRECSSSTASNNDSTNAGHASMSTESPDYSGEGWHLPPPPAPPPGSSCFSHPLERLKYSPRGGQDLSNRYLRLERALRGKEEYQREIEEFRDEEESLTAEGASASPGAEVGSSVAKGKKQQPLVFMGYTIPEAPKPPGPDECCMSGCAVCVHDLYAEALEAHDHTMQTIRSALHDKGVAEDTWPKQLRNVQSAELGEGVNGNEGERRDLTGKDLVKAKQASLSAFEQMELQLAARKRAQEHTPTRGDLEAGNVGSEMDSAKPLKREMARPRMRSGSGGRSPGTTKIEAKDVLKALSWVMFSRR